MKIAAELKEFDNIISIFSDKTMSKYTPTLCDLELDEQALKITKIKNNFNGNEIKLLLLNNDKKANINEDNFKSDFENSKNIILEKNKEQSNDNLRFIKSVTANKKDNSLSNEEITPIKNDVTDNYLQRYSVIDDINAINTNIKNKNNFNYENKEQLTSYKKSMLFQENNTEKYTVDNSDNTHVILLEDKTIQNEEINNYEKQIMPQKSVIEINENNTFKNDKNEHLISNDSNRYKLNFFREQEEINENNLNNDYEIINSKINESIKENLGERLSEININQTENKLGINFEDDNNKSKFNILFKSILMEFNKMNKKMNLLESNMQSYLEQMESFNNESVFNKNSDVDANKIKELQKFINSRLSNNDGSKKINSEEIKDLLDLSNRKIDYLTNLITKNFQNANNNHQMKNTANYVITSFALNEESTNKTNNGITQKSDQNIYVVKSTTKNDSEQIGETEQTINEFKNNSMNKFVKYENDSESNMNNNFIINQQTKDTKTNLSKNHNSTMHIKLNDLVSEENLNLTIQHSNFIISNNKLKNEFLKNSEDLRDFLLEKLDDQKHFQINFISRNVIEQIENLYELNKSCNSCFKIKFKFEVKECFNCLTKYCKDCALYCLQCDAILCQNCIGCRICQELICIKCRKPCFSCKLNLNKKKDHNQFYEQHNNHDTRLNFKEKSDHEKYDSNKNDNFQCLKMISNKNILVCDQCITNCFYCEEPNCVECIKECQRCQKNVCNLDKSSYNKLIKNIPDYNYDNNNNNNLIDIYTNSANLIDVFNPAYLNKKDISVKKDCSKTCKNCEKCICISCEKPSDFTKCPSCKDYFCNSCKSFCVGCKLLICRKCADKCKKCDKTICKKCSTACHNCREVFCALENCFKNNFKSKCKKCNKNFCNHCVKDYTSKCLSCSETLCKKCILVCGKCEANLCFSPHCNAKCDNCAGVQCLKCLIFCVCKKFKFCENCSLDISTINPHDCNSLVGDCSYFTGLKARSKLKLPKKNFEIKFFLEKYSGENISVGVTDNDAFDKDTMLFIDNIWVLKLNNGMKYSSFNSLEPFIKTGGLNAFDFLYLVIDEDNFLSFKVNNNPLNKAFLLDEKKDYFLYFENDDVNKDFKITIIFIKSL